MSGLFAAWPKDNSSDQDSQQQQQEPSYEPEELMLHYPEQDPFLPFLAARPKVVVRSNEVPTGDVHLDYAQSWLGWVKEVNGFDFPLNYYSQNESEQSTVEEDGKEEQQAVHEDSMDEGNLVTEFRDEESPQEDDFDESIFEPIKDRSGSYSYVRPKLTFTCLIALAIKSSDPVNGIGVQDIYQYIVSKFPYYEFTPVTNWKNSVRHNLSQSGIFAKSRFKRTAKKGYNWIIDRQREKQVKKEFAKNQCNSIRKLKSTLSGPQVLKDMIAVGLVDSNLIASLKKKKQK